MSLYEWVRVCKRVCTNASQNQQIMHKNNTNPADCVKDRDTNEEAS